MVAGQSSDLNRLNIYLGKHYYQHAVENVEHYKAVGVTRLYLADGEEEFPWDYVTRVVRDGSFSNGSCSIRIEADHPCGLTFLWSVQLHRERMDTDDWNIRYIPNREQLLALAGKLPEHARPMAAKVLEEYANQAAEYGDEMHERVCDYWKEATVYRAVAGVLNGDSAGEEVDGGSEHATPGTTNI